MDEGEEEITIDLKKVKNFFKTKQEEPKKEEVKTDSSNDNTSQQEKNPVSNQPQNPSQNIDSQKSDEDISFDFKKIKSIFKTKKAEHHETKDDDINFDYKSVWNFLVKHKTVFLILIPIFLSIFLRVQPADLPVTDRWASDNVLNFYRNQVTSQINAQYPNLPEANRNALGEQEFQKVLQTNRANIDRQIAESSAFFKSRLQDENGQTYLLAIDPYFWMRHAQNIIDHGHPGDIIRDGKQIDDHMFAPIGREVPYDMFHAYFTAYLFKFVQFFNRDLDLMALAFYTPVLLSALAVIPAFFIGRRVAGNYGGLVGSIMIAIHPSFLTRTAGGFADTDAYNVLVPLLITWFFLSAFESKKFSKIAFFGCLAGLITGIYSFTWGGWWYIFDFLLASSAIFITYELFVHRKELKKGISNIFLQPLFKNTLLAVFFFFVSSTIFTLIFSGFSIYKGFIIGPGFFTRLKEVGIDTVWPNVYTTVAEQNPASYASVIGNLNGSLFFYIAIFGILLCLLKKDENNRLDIKYFVLLAIWFPATIWAAMKGVRFSLLLVPAFGLAFGAALGISIKYISNFASKYLQLNKKITFFILGGLFLLLLIKPYQGAMGVAVNEIPSMNDAWYTSLDRIKQDSQPDAIINSWWDFGHWFKYVADRAVTFDGTSQATPMAHWIGNALLTGDEIEAIGILRMMDCGSNNAFDELDKEIKDTPRSVDILYEIIVKDKETAKNILSNYGLSDETINNVIKNTHCDPPENYFITSQDMIGKSGVWAHFGSWNFDRALIYNRLKTKKFRENKQLAIDFLQERFNYTQEVAENFYFEVQNIKNSGDANSWIAPWPSYGGSRSRCVTIDPNNIACDYGQGIQVNINLVTLEANIPTGQQIFYPNSIGLLEEDGIRIKEFTENLGGLSVAIIPVSDTEYDSLLTHPQLVDSMFTRMFFMDGHGLKYFDMFSDERSTFGGRIIVWKVDWDGLSANVAGAFIPPPQPEQPEIIIQDSDEDINQIREPSEENNNINNENISSE